MGEDRVFDPREYEIGLDDLVGSVVKVGGGRGFIVADGEKRIRDGGKSYVVTAAHCLPSLPRPNLWGHLACSSI
jgi:hypothetical protein